MTGLLDTHVLLWAADDSDQLSGPAREFLLDPANTIVVSVASVWEIVIKHGLGKLHLNHPLEVILSRLPGANIGLLPIAVGHVLAVANLPKPPKDPFDRVLAATAVVEGAVLVTADAIFRQYPVTVVW